MKQKDFIKSMNIIVYPTEVKDNKVFKKLIHDSIGKICAVFCYTKKQADLDRFIPKVEFDTITNLETGIKTFRYNLDFEYKKCVLNIHETGEIKLINYKNNKEYEKWSEIFEALV